MKTDEPTAQEALDSLWLMSLHKNDRHLNLLGLLPRPWEVFDKSSPKFSALFAIRCLVISVKRDEDIDLAERRQGYAIEMTRLWLNAP